MIHVMAPPIADNDPPGAPADADRRRRAAQAAGLGAFGAAYELDSAGKLGEGQFSVVRLATDRRSGRKVAVKCIKKAGLGEEDLLALVVRCSFSLALRARSRRPRAAPRHRMRSRS